MVEKETGLTFSNSNLFWTHYYKEAHFICLIEWICHFFAMLKTCFSDVFDYKETLYDEKVYIYKGFSYPFF